MNWKTEILRKLTHVSGLLFLPLLYWNPFAFASVMAAALSAYLLTEWSAAKGIRIPFLSSFVADCKRPSEGRISRGAVLLAVSGIILPFLISAPAAILGLGQAYLADTLATLAGKRWGHRRLPWSPEKSWMGSAVFVVAATILGLFFLSAPAALLIALVGAGVESLPLREMDNVTVPLATGLAFQVLFATGLF